MRGSTLAIIGLEGMGGLGHPARRPRRRSERRLCCRRWRSKLNPGEQVIFEGHPSWRSILGFYIKGILITAAIALVVGLVTDR